MSELTKFECDVSGEYFGAKNDVIEFEVRRHVRNSPFQVSKRKVHISLEVLTDLALNPPHLLKYVGVKDGEVVGASIGHNPTHSDLYYEYEERGSFMLEGNEAFFQFVEDEILY